MRIFLGMAVYREVKPATNQMCMTLVAEALRRGHDIHPLQMVGDALVSRARSRLATMFVRSKFDVWLSLDADVYADPADLIAMCQRAVDHEAIVGGFYVTRSDPPQPAVLLPKGVEIDIPSQELVPIEYAATGCCAFPHAIVNAVETTLELVDTDSRFPFRPSFAPFVHEGMYLSEDWAFQQRAKAMGAKVLLDPSVLVDHHDERVLRAGDLYDLGPTPTRVTVRRDDDQLAVYRYPRPVTG